MCGQRATSKICPRGKTGWNWPPISTEASLSSLCKSLSWYILSNAFSRYLSILFLSVLNHLGVLRSQCMRIVWEIIFLILINIIISSVLELINYIGYTQTVRSSWNSFWIFMRLIYIIMNLNILTIGTSL